MQIILFLILSVFAENGVEVKSHEELVAEHQRAHQKLHEDAVNKAKQAQLGTVH
jgi:hypothetical protein